jgi:hypothetical protein
MTLRVAVVVADTAVPAWAAAVVERLTTPASKRSSSSVNAAPPISTRARGDPIDTRRASTRRERRRS